MFKEINMDFFYKILDYIIPIITGLLIIVFAIRGYKNAKRVGTERKNIRYMIMGGIMILASLLLAFLW